MEKKDLLLLHGALGSKKQFDSLIPLLENEFEIYTLDFSGHGEKALRHEFGIITFANEVLDELVIWDMDNINVFGYSMGGYVASYLALRTNRIQKVFTLGTKFLWTLEYAEKEVLKLNYEQILQKVPGYAAELQARHTKTDWKELLEKTSAMMLDLGRFNLLPLDVIPDIDTELCIGTGDLDNTVTIDESVSVFHAAPYSRLCVVPDTRHPLENVNPVLLAELIKQYFK